MTVELAAIGARAAKPTASTTNQIVRTTLIVFVVALVASLAMVFVGFRSQSFVDSTFDPYYFGEMGKSLARGEGFEPYGSLIQRRAPLYPLLIGGLYSAFGEQPMLVLLTQCLLMAATSVVVYDLGRRLFNQRTGVLAAIFVAFNPMLLRYVGDLQLETLLTFLLSVTVWASVRFYLRPTVGWGILLGVSAALASLTKAVVLPFPFLFAAAIVALTLYRRARWQHEGKIPWAPLVALFASLVICIAPWTIRNYVSTGGKLVLISSGASDAFLRGYVFSRVEFATLRQPPYEVAENESNDLFRGLAQAAGTEWQRDDYETDQILNRAAQQRFFADPKDFVRKFTVGLFTFWYEMTNLTNSLLAGTLALGAWGLAIVGLRRAMREDRPAWLLLLPVVYLNLFLAALLALGRYSVPILPALLILSAFGVDTLLRRFWPRSAARG